ncbi:hypothetical protein [Sediminicoccus sp. KRV36]|uniref:hypothetical protein n=1 Tax=Sediminicoccus sp. KRV36 TaxID=3133721 RepID=UPI00200EE830|nr:hypothetical protein [Sediminicoccus rosea]UPY37925.1 hypothetical protein LHU95_04295 [Sediminicoccus rosea]
MITWLDFEGTGRRALASNIALPVLVAASALGMAHALGGMGGTAPLAQTVWIMLLAGMGAARWRLAREAEAGWLRDGRRGPEAWEARRWLGLLMLIWLVSPALGLLGHAMSLALAITVLWKAGGAGGLAAMRSAIRRDGRPR